MAKRNRTQRPVERSESEVGPRQPCPCGSGRRYKACHGAAGGSAAFVVRSFEGLPGECDWIAMREFLQAGSAELTLRAGAFDGAADGTTVRVVSLLPGIAPALRREDGAVWLGLQVASQSGDASADLGEALARGLAQEPGTAVETASQGAGPRLQDVVEPDSPFEVTVHQGFDFWFDGVADPDGNVAATLEQINASVQPAARLTSVSAAYWVQTPSKEHLRWVLPHDEEALLTGLARLHAAGADAMTEGSRLVGSFRAHGLLVPVWDLPTGTGAEALEEPAVDFEQRLGQALSETAPLTTEERAARQGLAHRQLTIR